MYRGKMHGLARYVYAVLGELAAQNREYEFGVIAADQSFSGLAASLANIEPVLVRAAPFSLREHWELPPVIKAWNPAIYHAPSLALPASLSGRFVVTVPDLTVYHYPTRGFEKLFFKLAIRPVLQRARRIIVYSQHTADDVCLNMGVKPERVLVSVLGVDPSYGVKRDKSQVDQLLQRLNLKQPYVLCVSNPKQHKNLAILLQAWKLLAPKELQLVIVSTPAPWLEQAVAEQAGVHRLSAIPEQDMPTLYQAAVMLVFPSLYEGFGLPAVEAMKAGLPVVAARAASIPEVVGSAGILFDPHDASQLADIIQDVANNSAKRDQMRQQGLERAESFQWSETAAVHMRAYREAVADS